VYRRPMNMQFVDKNGTVVLKTEAASAGTEGAQNEQKSVQA
jgi:hypothetical protein